MHLTLSRHCAAPGGVLEGSLKIHECRRVRTQGRFGVAPQQDFAQDVDDRVRRCTKMADRSTADLSFRLVLHKFATMCPTPWPHERETFLLLGTAVPTYALNVAMRVFHSKSTIAAAISSTGAPSASFRNILSRIADTSNGTPIWNGPERAARLDNDLSLFPKTHFSLSPS